DHALGFLVETRIADRDQDVPILLVETQRFLVHVAVQITHLQRGRVHDQLVDLADRAPVRCDDLPPPGVRVVGRHAVTRQIAQARETPLAEVLGGLLQRLPLVDTLPRPLVHPRVGRDEAVLIVPRDAPDIVCVRRDLTKLLLRHPGHPDHVVLLVDPRLADGEEDVLPEETQVDIQVTDLAGFIDQHVVDLAHLLLVRERPVLPAADVEGTRGEGVVRLFRQWREPHAPSSALAATLPVPTGEGGAGPASVRPVPPCPARPIPRGVPSNLWCKVWSMRRPCPTGVFPSSFFCAGDRRRCTHLSYPQGDTI